MNKTKLLTIIELARGLGVTRSLIAHMVSRGLTLQDGKASLQAAFDWLQSNPYPLSP